MLEILVICLLAIVVSFFTKAFAKYKEDKLKEKLEQLLRKFKQDDILQGDTPVDIKYPNTSLEHYVYLPYRRAFISAFNKNDFKECERLLVNGFLKNMRRYFSDDEFELLRNNDNVKNYLKVKLHSLIEKYW